MSDDLQQRGQDLLRRFASSQERQEHLSGQVRNEELLLSQAAEKHEKILKEVEIVGHSLETVKKALVPLTEMGLKKLKELISFGLRTIFHDEIYAVDIEIKDRGSEKTAEFWLVEGTGDDQFRVKLRDACGGGVKTVVALILRIFFILHYKQRRIIALDEPFTDLNSHYIPGLFNFLRHTVDELGFRWMIVTQDDRFLPYADFNYRVHKGEVKLVSTKEDRGSDGAYA